MKLNKVMALMLGALAVGCMSCNTSGSGGDAEVKIDALSSQVKVNVGESVELAYDVTPANTQLTWESRNEAVATVEDGVVTGVSKGNTVVLAKAGEVSAKFFIQVGEGESGKTSFTLKAASEYYPVYVDDATKEKMGDKIVADFGPDDVTNFFYPWVIEGTENLTYEFVTATGRNFYDTEEGGYIAMVCGTAGWAGGGYAGSAVAIQSLIDKINAEPDKYFFHLGMRSTDGYGNEFYFFGQEKTAHFIIGSSKIYSGTYIFSDYPRDGYWHEFDVPMSQFANALAGLKVQPDNTGAAYIVSFLTQGIPGAQLNYDAMYFYKK